MFISRTKLKQFPMDIPQLIVTRYPWGMDIGEETNSPVGMGNETELGNGDGNRYTHP